MGEFDDHKEVVQHIPSRFSKEMARKSTTVSSRTFSSQLFGLSMIG